MRQQRQGSRAAGGAAAPAGHHVGKDREDALEEFLDRKGAELLRYVVRWLPPDLRRSFDPLDVVQDVFLKAFCLADDCPLDDQDATIRWLKTIARHHIGDLGRRQRALKRGGPGLVGGGDTPRYPSLDALLQDLLTHSRTPSKSAAAHEFCRALQSALERLAPDQGQVIRLRYVDGLSAKQAAERIGRSEKATENLLYRALAALRLEMGSASFL